MDKENMKTIDLHTGKFVLGNENRYVNSISGNFMKDYVCDNIDFNLSDVEWILIDKYFGEYWNNIVGIGGYFYWDEVTDFIYQNIINQKQLISQERIKFIVELMLAKIEKDGGFL